MLDHQQDLLLNTWVMHPSPGTSTPGDNSPSACRKWGFGFVGQLDSMFLAGSGGKTNYKHLLVGGWATPLKNMSSSVGMMTFPINMGNIKNGNQTTKQFINHLQYDHKWAVCRPSLSGDCWLHHRIEKRLMRTSCPRSHDLSVFWNSIITHLRAVPRMILKEWWSFNILSQI